jgi:serine/threonine protein kinase
MEKTILQHYRIDRQIGQGGMATVYLAHDNKFDTNVAIKVLNKEYVHNDNIRKRFLAEAKSMFKMSHPNIIKVNDLIEENDTVAFVMEYIEGETLKEYIDHKGKLKDDEIKTIFSQMLEAVGYVHEQNLVHRDIKPSNFMIDKKGKVKLMDFGIAKTLDASSSEYTQTGTGMQMGTPMYMSPEQITETKSVTAQSDIYSLGVVLWQMVTGQKPYDTKTLSNFQLQSKIVNEPLLPTRTPWDAAISKATAKEAQARYSSASEFSKALHAENNAPDNHDATLVGGGKEETVVQKGHDKTVVDDSPKQKKDISLNERFEQERINKVNNEKSIKYPILYCLLPGILLHVFCFSLQYMFGYDLLYDYFDISSDSLANSFLVLGFVFFIKFNVGSLWQNLKKQPLKNILLLSGSIFIAFSNWQQRLWGLYFLSRNFSGTPDIYLLENVYLNNSVIVSVALFSFSLIIISVFVNNRKN